MDTIAARPTVRRLVLGAVAAAVLSLGPGVAAAHAAPAGRPASGACAAAQSAFDANMAEAKVWIDAADRLAGAGNEAGANAATDEANHFLDAAGGALGDRATAC